MEEKLDAILDSLEKLSKKVDRLQAMNTKIAKFLHLIPVTEKEEYALQIAQRKNMQISGDVAIRIADMEKIPNNTQDFNINTIFQNTSENGLFSDVLAEDFLKGGSDS